ncbi:hypothetical protein KBB68_02165 [Candidatus Babeliales bacterium]|nr:hypothetical protein [Candidatus Babeliales bacterium]
MMILNDFDEKFTGSKSDQFPVLLDLQQALSDGVMTMCSRYTMNLMEKIVNHVQAHMKEDYPDFKKIYDEFHNNKRHVSEVFAFIRDNITDTYDKNLLKIFITYQDTVKWSTNFVKDVSNDYVLWIPQKLVSRDLDDDMLGLQISKLKDYTFEAIPEDSLTDFEQGRQKSVISTETMNWGRKRDEYARSMNFLAFNHYPAYDTTSVGQRLIAALNEIKPEHAQFLMNIYLIAHGSDEFTAGISTSKPQKVKDSDFVKLLKDLQNNFLMKSLSITSCYSGGKKNIEAFKITNQFDNHDLEKISYPIIMGNSFFSKEMNLHIKDYGDEYFNFYFYALNQTPPNYSQAATMTATGKTYSYDSREIVNLVSIKMPHTSWFTPEVFSRNMQKITQIQASIQKDITVPFHKKIILLSANIVDTINCTFSFHTKFFPMNYVNQNYLIKRLNYVEEDSFNTIIPANLSKSFLSISSLKEPIRTVIQEIVVNKEVRCKNIYFFNYVTNELGHAMSGYMYTNIEGKVFKSTWFDDSRSSFNYEVEATNEEKRWYQKGIEGVRKASEQGQKSTEELEKNLNKRNQSEFKISEKVEQSHKRTEERSDHDWVKDPETKKWKFQAKVNDEFLKIPFMKRDNASTILKETEDRQISNFANEYQEKTANSPREVDYIHV